MAKAKSGYKRRSWSPTAEGEKIPLAEPTYQRVVIVAYANGCTVGQWCEAKLRQCLAVELNVPPPPRTIDLIAQADARERSFQIDDRLILQIGMFAGTKGRTARQWLRATLLYCLAIEEERLRGLREQPDRYR